MAKKLSLFAATLINVNIMLGTGLFINTVILAKYVGSLSPIMYLTGGIVMLPLILCIAKLTTMHSNGDFYSFGSMIHPYLGFLSSWGYFIGKLASAALGIHVFNGFLQMTIPAFCSIPIMVLNTLFISFFVALNMNNVKTGSNIQYTFVIMKIIPIIFVFAAAAYYFNILNILPANQIWDGAPIALPLGLFSCIGFEASCSLTRVIEDSRRNAPRAILFSYAIVMTLAIAYQFSFYGILGSSLGSLNSYLEAFPALTNFCLTRGASFASGICSLSIAMSALGSAYGIMYSNIWNLNTLAQKNHIIGKKLFTNLNQHHIPYACVVAEGIIIFSYLFLTQGNQVPMQYVAALACIISYTISISGLLSKERSFIGILGIMNCMILLAVCTVGFAHTSMAPLKIFLGIMIVGTIMYWITNQPNEASRSSA